MTTLNQSTHSVSPGGSPETYHGHPGMSSGHIYPHKNTYRHIPGHVQGVGNAPQQQQQPYGSVVVANGSGVQQYPSHMAVHGGQYYPIPGPNAGFMPMYSGAALPEHQPYYYYQQGPNSNWAMQTPMHVYPPQAYTTSPPSTPPQPQLPYGYPMLAHEFLPPSPPQPSYHNHSNHNHNHNHNQSNRVPGLDHRRNSWSSSGATDTPTTPFATTVDPVPAIVGEPGTVEDRTKDIGKTVESLLLSGPPLPRPVPAIYAPGTTNLAYTLDNPTNTTNVYIRGLPPDTDDDKLYEMTCRFGTVVSHKAIMDTEHGTCKGYGFARYETKEEAENCIRGLVSLKYEAGFARESFNARLKTLADPNSTNIYVSNLPRSMTEKDMQDIFAGYVVVSNRILRDAHGVSRGVGFARFESREICNEIIKNFHGIPVGEEALALQVRYADTSAQKRLKATTTKKRQFRSNEYNNLVNGAYYNQPHVPYGPTSQFRNRVWVRQNSMTSNGSSDAGVTLSSRDTHSSSSGSTRKNWDRSQDWKNTGDENKDWKPSGTWRNSGGAATDASSKLETVHEDDGDTVSEVHSEGTTIPTVIEYGLMCRSVGRASSGSLSDPGDSYGGREYRKDDSFIC